MKRFKKVLVYVNTDLRRHPALDRAARVAEVAEGTLKAVAVVEELPVSLQLPAYGYPALSETLAREKKARLEKLVAPLRKRGLQVETEVLYGKPFLQIIRQVLEHRFDLVMKTAEGGGFTKLFGTTAMRLLRKCPCPVWLVKPGQAGRYARVLAAVDPLSGHDEQDALNTKIMELASSISKLEGSELHVVHAWHTFGHSVLNGIAGVPEQQLKKFAIDMRKHAQTNLSAFLSNFPVRIPKDHVHLLEGDPGVVIREFARKRRMNLIVMGTVVRTGVAGILIGNTAEKVLGQVNCSVLAVKPDSFVSPVTLE